MSLAACPEGPAIAGPPRYTYSMKTNRRFRLGALASILAIAWLALDAALSPLYAAGNLRGKARISAQRASFVPPQRKTPPLLPASRALPERPAEIRASASTDPNEPPRNLESGKAELHALEGRPDRGGEIFEGSEPLSSFEDPDVARIGAHVDRELSAMGAVLGTPDHPLFGVIRKSARRLLGNIDSHIKSGRIAPKHEIRASKTDPPKGLVDRPLRVGIYPVAADPPHWAHLFVAGQAMDELQLDKVVFIVGGDDARKPLLTKAETRHPMNQAVLAAYAPLFAYSPIAFGESLDGETNMFKLLALNAAQKIHAYYIVGEDHYRPNDTISKIENNSLDPKLGFNPAMHAVSVAFTEREELGKERTGASLNERILAKEVPTSLEIKPLPRMDFIASSSQVKKGDLILTPYAVYDYVRKNRLGLYGIQPSGGN